MESFQGISPHRPLSPSDQSEIRIVKLYPAKFDDPVRCDLEHVSLEATHKPAFASLSYAWGDAKVTKPITLNGIEYPVTTNLESFLRHMQSVLKDILDAVPHAFLHQRTLTWFLDQCPDYSAPGVREEWTPRILRVWREMTGQAGLLVEPGLGTRAAGSEDDDLDDFTPAQPCLHIWIDAISIHQSNIEERNVQVTRMGDIYSSASFLFVWLGPEPGDVSINAKAAFSLCDEVEQRWQAVSRPPEVPFETHSFKFATSICPSDLVYERWEDVVNLSALCQMEWFSRLWILQEVALSTSAAQLWLGFHHANFSRFLAVAEMCVTASMDAMMWDRVPRYTESQMNLLVGAYQSLDRIGKFRRNWPVSDGGYLEQPSDNALASSLLPMLVRATKAAQATDPRDFVYALVSLLPPTKELPQELRPNYAETMGSVFHGVAAYFIRHLGRRALPFLFLATEPVPFSHAPSWVPMFSWPAIVPDLIWEPDNSFERQQGVCQGEEMVCISPCTRRLKLKAALLDEIEFVAFLPLPFYVRVSHEQTPEEARSTLGAYVASLETTVLENLGLITGCSAEEAMASWKGFWEKEFLGQNNAWNVIRYLVTALVVIGEGKTEDDESRAELGATRHLQRAEVIATDEKKTMYYEKEWFNENQAIGRLDLGAALFTLRHIRFRGIGITSGGHLVLGSARCGKIREGDIFCVIDGVPQACIIGRHLEDDDDGGGGDGERYTFRGPCSTSTLGEPEDELRRPPEDWKTITLE